jgi:hypothetical protein
LAFAADIVLMSCMDNRLFSSTNFRTFNQMNSNGSNAMRTALRISFLSLSPEELPLKLIQL